MSLLNQLNRPLSMPFCESVQPGRINEHHRMLGGENRHKELYCFDVIDYIKTQTALCGVFTEFPKALQFKRFPVLECNESSMAPGVGLLRIDDAGNSRRCFCRGVGQDVLS